MRHALRNALIAPFTIIVLQLNWLLSGVVVVEVFFQYAGFGKLLLDAALYGDIYVIQAATLVAVFVAVLSQIVSDVGYTFPTLGFALHERGRKMTAAEIALQPALPLRLRIRQADLIVALLLLMWIPLTLYVMFGSYLGATLKNIVLLPAISATIALYLIAVTSWRESPVAVIGATLVFFWLFVAVSAPYLPLIDPNRPIAPFAEIGAFKKDHWVPRRTSRAATCYRAICGAVSACWSGGDRDAGRLRGRGVVWSVGGLSRWLVG